MSTVMSSVQTTGASADDRLRLDGMPRPGLASVLRVAAAYAAMIVLSILLFLLIRAQGQGLVARGSSGFGTTGLQADTHTFAQVLLALVVILVASRAVGTLFRRIRQPAVMGEICAGVLLGPSLLGYLAPDVSSYLFPASLAPYLGMIAQAGVVVFMFLVGLEFDPKLVATRSHAALAISHAGIVAPLLLGATLALAIYPTVATADVPFTVFAMFMGISMSVTAFPVLARILSERRLQATPVGAMALTCAAVGDATAWCLLALFIGIARERPGGGVVTAYLTVGYVIVMFTAVRPLITRFARRYEDGEPTQGALAVILTCLLLSALATEAIGIHAIFGAFLFGAIIPHDTKIARRIVENLENVVVVVLLPVFFAFTGLRTQIGLISGMGAWLLCGLLILVACAGKFGGTLCAARLSGIQWRQAAVLATLMNTRGLMELIVLNIGLDLKIISPTLFTMLVVMALVTTFLTSPVVDALTAGGRRVKASIL